MFGYDGFYYTVVNIGIQDNHIPTNDVSIVIILQHPLGGATVNSSCSNVTIIIMAHDFVAGIFSFNQTQYRVKEGRLINNLHQS